MSNLLDLTASTLHRGIQSTVPLLLAATGELIAERAGLVNIGIEGTMLVGALAGAAAAWASGSVGVGLIAALIAGALVGLIFAAWTVWGARDQIVTGLAVNLLALGLTGAALERINHGAAAHAQTFTPPRMHSLLGVDPATSPLLHALLDHDALTLATIGIVIATAISIRYSRVGLTLRAVGENPEAADTAGIRVGWARTAAAAAGSALAGLGGAYLSLAISDRFQEGMTDGRGFVALALVIFGGWSAPRIALGALFFGLLDALQVTLQPRLGAWVHVLYPALLALPYLLTLAALAGFVTRARPPAALASPYRRG